MSAPAERELTPILLLLTAPSGAGKTTVSHGLLGTIPGLARVITCTTRPPRAGERDAVDYHFLTLDDFERRIAAGEFLEYAEVYGNRYGTLRSTVCDRLTAGSDVLLSVDVQGAETIRAAAAADPTLGDALVSVFLMPPSLDEQARRLRGRDQDPPEVIQRRVRASREEMEHWPHFHYLVISGTMSEDLAAMKQIMAVEKLRSTRTRRLLIH